MAHTTVNVYGLAGPDGVIKYVGQTVRDLKTRLRSHAFYARRGDAAPVAAWIRDLGQDNVTPVLLEVCTHADRYDRERHWVNAHRTSVAEGGCNVWVRGAIPDELRASLAARARLAGAANKGKKRGPLSEEHKAKLRAMQPAITERVRAARSAAARTARG